MRWRPAVIVLALVVPTVSASAATVGLDGGNSDPIPITDSSWQRLEEALCIFSVDPLDPTYRCALYDGSVVPSITSIDFQLKDDNGELIAWPDHITVDQFSALDTLTESTLLPDGFTFNLSTDGDALICFTCVFFSQPAFIIGVADPRWVSIVAVNGVRNAPEPGTLLLFGSAVALALRRRFRVMKRDGTAVTLASGQARRPAQTPDR